MTNLKTATKLFYRPRGTAYKVTAHNVMIKQSIGLLEEVLSKLKLIPEPPSWELGCTYTDITTNKTYARPYSAFHVDKWTAS